MVVVVEVQSINSMINPHKAQSCLVHLSVDSLWSPCGPWSE